MPERRATGSTPANKNLKHATSPSKAQAPTSTTQLPTTSSTAPSSKRRPPMLRPSASSSSSSSSSSSTSPRERNVLSTLVSHQPMRATYTNPRRCPVSTSHIILLGSAQFPMMAQCVQAAQFPVMTQCVVLPGYEWSNLHEPWSADLPAYAPATHCPRSVKTPVRFSPSKGAGGGEGGGGGTRGGGGGGGGGGISLSN
eukprot:1130250-Rhodomonas_salina.2